MKYLWNQLMPFATDSTGVCSMFADTDALVLGHDPRSSVERNYRATENRRDMTSVNVGLQPSELSFAIGDIDYFVQLYTEILTQFPRRLVVLVHSPVSSLVNMDLTLCADALKKAIPGLEIFTVPTNGNYYYDIGLSRAFETVLKEAAPTVQKLPDTVNILGLNTLDFPSGAARAAIHAAAGQGGKRIHSIFGMETDLARMREAPRAAGNVVASVSGLAAARWMEREFDIPFVVLEDLPQLAETCAGPRFAGKPRILVIGEQFSSNLLRRILMDAGAGSVNAASWFTMDDAYMHSGDLRINSEDDLTALLGNSSYDMVIGSPVFEIFSGGTGRTVFFPLPHPPISGGTWRNTEESRNPFSRETLAAIVSPGTEGRRYRR
jgi:hypothetical protein